MSKEQLILWLSLLLASCAGPPLDLEHHRGSVVVDFRQLGEYPSAVARLRIEDVRTRDPIWEVRASSGSPQLWTIRLTVGENLGLLEGVIGGEYETVFPVDAMPFELQPDRDYRLLAWDKDGKGGPRRIVFRLAS